MSNKQHDGNELVLVPLGGAGEIGMNIYMYGYGPKKNRQWLMVDVGLTFPGPDEPGIELIFPDIGFLEKKQNNLVGIVLTHAHEDHLGALTSFGRVCGPRSMRPPLPMLYCKAKLPAMVRVKTFESHRNAAWLTF